jgi:hypothetical protein
VFHCIRLPLIPVNGVRGTHRHSTGIGVYSPRGTTVSLICQTDIHFERPISDDSSDYGKFADGATRDPEKGVPGLFPEVANENNEG